MRKFDVAARMRALLAVPDPPEMVDLNGDPRGRRYTCAGDTFRQDLVKRDLERAYVRWHMFEHGEEARIVSVRRIQLVRRRA